MPSPFPGMDPYLENPELWPNVHARLIADMQNLLNPRLRPNYVARIELRVYLIDDDSATERIPDMRVERTNFNGRRESQSATLEITPSLRVRTHFALEVEEPRLEILDVDSRKVVTVIEILSPANKRPGTNGFRSFMSKRREIMEAECHWVEIDLLRTGRSTLDRSKLSARDYLVHVSRVEDRPHGAIWPIGLQAPLPIIGIPLREGDPDVPLDLGALLRTSYEISACDLTIDYKADPVPPLDPEQAAWADALLKQKGLR